MKKIELTSGKYALVDDEDFEYLNQFNWFASTSDGEKWYARRNVCGNKRVRKIAMHREIMSFPDGQVDHKDGDGLNNQKYNLRKCTQTQNLKNKAIYKNNKTGYKGVSWHKQHRKYYSSIRMNGKSIFLGLFVNPIDAARAYDKKAHELFGEFASPNFGFSGA